MQFEVAEGDRGIEFTFAGHRYPAQLSGSSDGIASGKATNSSVDISSFGVGVWNVTLKILLERPISLACDAI